MCGRYYLADDWEDMIDEAEKGAEAKAAFRKEEGVGKLRGDIHPMDLAPVISADSGKDRLKISAMRWGFPGRGNGVIFNARAESVHEKALFRGIAARRTVMPATSFYEWNSEKEKFSFTRRDRRTLFLGGFFDLFENERRFIIITTEANPSMLPVHDRMPLIIGPDEVEAWIRDDSETDRFLHRPQTALNRQTDYEQLSLFD